MSELWDPDALGAFRRGESAMLTRVYRDHVDEVARMVRDGFSFTSGNEALRFAGVRNTSDQQDLVQEAFVRALSTSARTNYDGTTPFGAYLRGITKNVVIDHLRKSKRMAAEPIDDAHLPAAANDNDTEAPPNDAALRDIVLSFEHLLPVLEQRFVAVRYAQGLTQIETAKRLGVGRSHVRTLEQRVRQRLLKKLGQAGYIDASHGRPLQALLAALSSAWLWALQEWL
jgi:RNA polymerase sigma factor (sigma-70 family)